MSKKMGISKMKQSLWQEIIKVNETQSEEFCKILNGCFCTKITRLEAALIKFNGIIDRCYIRQSKPSYTSKDKQERGDAKKIITFRCVMKGTLKGIAYPEVIQLFKDRDVEFLINTDLPDKFEGMKQAREIYSPIIDRSFERQYRPLLSSEDEQEKADAKKLAHFRGAIKGTAEGVAYPEVIQLFKDRDVEFLINPDLPDKFDGMKRAREIYNPIIDRSIARQYRPLLSSKDEQEQEDSRKLMALRGLLRGTRKTGVVYPEVIQLFIERKAQWIINTKDFDLDEWAKKYLKD